jgi:predicted nucleic acid-binding protein
MVAIVSKNDQHHERCSEALAAVTPPLFTCWPVITEATWLLRKRPEAIDKVFEGFRGGFYSLLGLDADALLAIAALMNRYNTLGVQLADVALAYLAEREKIRTIFTIDRRDFTIIRLKRGRTLRLIPEIL